MNSMIIILTGSLAAIFTYFLNNKLKLGGVVASAGISLLGGLFFYLFPAIPNAHLSEILPAVIMGASFVGMASEKVISNSLVILLAGMLFGLVFLLTGPFFEGFGGSLGTSAAIALLSVYGLELVIKRVAF